MAEFPRSVTFLFVTACLFSLTLAQSCSTYSFRSNNQFAACNALPVLDSFLHWTYHQSNRTVDLAYRHNRITASNWVVWSLNPTGGRMRGAQCLVAFRNSTGDVRAYTSPISRYETTLQEAPLSFRVPRLSAEFVGNSEMIIYATVELPQGGTAFTHVWQYGDVSGDVLLPHQQSGANLRSTGTIDFATGQVSNTGASSADSTRRKRNIHGVLNVVSWGVLLPLGAVAARYLKVFKSADPAWFYIHVSVQASAYAIGVAGWGMGLKLGSDSAGIDYDTHRNIGITLFVLGTLQVFALLLRPKPDHKLRLYWNIYHHSIGYTVIILSIINIFKGFDILDPEKKWKRIYIGILIFIGACAAVLEAFTWYIVLSRKRAYNKRPRSGHANGVNGYGDHA